ncbi:hypothetical protein SAMN02927914_01986 [Mesorhizobium qingshengii]|uniref:Uncharacterized protein n=1 Tax=Mesorhizobium qingshengii TaxID=1165689 RepID=A0A1G5X682_9HYPH|nr:hypothetical protein SAMN02927914_01986 [Mesorhizobium qingshengii]
MLRCTPLGARSPAPYIAVGGSESKTSRDAELAVSPQCCPRCERHLTHAGPYFAGAVFPAPN